MKDKIFRTTLQNQGHYEVRLLPNINDLSGNRLAISFKAAFGQMGWIKNHISYALINDDIKVFIYGDVVMRKIKDVGNVHEYIKFWDITKSSYLDIHTSEVQGFLKVDTELHENEIYNYNENRDYIEKLFETIRHIKLEDVLYHQLFLRAQTKWKDNYLGRNILMSDVYKNDYSDFEERYTVWLRTKKIKQIIG